MTKTPTKFIPRNTIEFETEAMVKPTGFREYDARWLFGDEINLKGLQALGASLGTLMHNRGIRPELVTGHDFRSYSQSVKQALTLGLISAGIKVHDIGLCMTPMAYFAQFALGVPAVAMVTASHNENGWTGIKMGINPPLTFGPDEMQELKDLTLNAKWHLREGGGLVDVPNFYPKYMEELLQDGQLKRKLKVIVACGNGTAGAFAPQVMRALGCEVIEMDCTLDNTFPNYNPNPEDMEMVHAMAAAVAKHGADVCFGFDGDGDRCGVVDSKGQVIFSDKIGLLLARDMSKLVPNAQFVVDVKSTGLYAIDEVLKANGASVDYWKTGHSHVKRRLHDLQAVAGFEKSGHFFLAGPFGRGYDDALVSAIAICRMLERAPNESLASLVDGLPKTWGTPTMSAHCADERKYQVVEAFSAEIETMQKAGGDIGGHKIDLITKINGIRFTLQDGSWGLVRASSNKPELVVVCESPVAEAAMRNVFNFINAKFIANAEIGEFNQTV
jgi:phosphomannomutase / phosphoglucomutase